MADTNVNPVWKYVATALGSFVLAMTISFGTNTFIKSDGFVTETYFNSANTRLEEKIEDNETETKELRLTLVQLNKAITDLRIEIARWADASEKNRKAN